MNYLAKMTVVELKSVADRMAVPYASRIKKADLIELIKDGIEFAHLRANEDAAWMAETDTPTYTLRDDNGTEIITVTGDSALIMIAHEKNVKRYNPGMVKDRNGKVILTAKQRKRITKKMHSYARKIGFLSPKVAA